MRIVLTSDLYHTASNLPALADLIDRIRRESPDVLLIAGNLGEPVEPFTWMLERFAALDCARGLVTGNRDVWSRGQDMSSQEWWEQDLPSLLERRNFVWLERENLVLGRVGICGTTGWYDYSGRDPKLGYTVEQYQELKGLVSDDARYVNWPWSDRDFASQLHEGFSERLQALELDREIDHILVLTHFPVFKDALSGMDGDIRWRFGAAYAFNLTLGRVIAPRNKVRHVVSGHSRLAGQWEITFGSNSFITHVVGHGEDTARSITIDI